jgi:hypothetical protein
MGRAELVVNASSPRTRARIAKQAMASTNRLATVVIVPRTSPHFSLIITAGDGARNVRRDELERKRLLAAAGRVNRRTPFLQTT